MRDWAEVRSPHFTIEYVEFIFTLTVDIYFIFINIKVARDKCIFT